MLLCLNCKAIETFLENTLFSLIQVNSAFVWAVAQGAETVIDGCVEPISGGPDDPAFLWGGLFLSQGGAGMPLGGERGRR